VNGFSVFLVAWMVLIAIVGWAGSTPDARDPRRSLAAFAGLIVAASTRDLICIYLGLEAVSLATLRLGARSTAGSIASLAGVALVAVSGETTDLAALEPTMGVKIGTVLLLSGILSRWLQSSAVDRFIFLGAGVTVVAVFARLTAWSPALAGALAPLIWVVAMAGVAAGSLGAALSATKSSLVDWLTIAMVALAVTALTGGAPVLPHVLVHVAASSVALALVLSGGSSLASWLTLLSLASFPPLPGFTTKLGLLASLSPVTLALTLASMFLVGVGCARALDRSEPEPGKVWVSAAVVAMTIAFGLFPGPLLALATRAAATLF
jgi:hypothetical protein